MKCFMVFLLVVRIYSGGIGQHKSRRRDSDIEHTSVHERLFPGGQLFQCFTTLKKTEAEVSEHAVAGHRLILRLREAVDVRPYWPEVLRNWPFRYLGMHEWPSLDGIVQKSRGLNIL